VSDEEAVCCNRGLPANGMEQLCMGGGEQVCIVSRGIFKLDGVSGEYACRSNGKIIASK
jgi:hypothetical protein